jgi:hypothetical protein
MILFKKSVITIQCLVILFTGFCVPAYSQDLSRGLVVYPSVQSIDLDKGRTYSYTVTIENSSINENEEVGVSFETFTASNEEGKPQITPFEKDDDVQNWISTDQSTFKLSKQESKPVSIDLSIPLEANPGGYYFAIVFTKSAKQTELSQVLITQRLVSLLFLNINGDAGREISFNSLANDQYIYDPFFDFVTLKSNINLKGRSYYKPTGTIWAYQNSTTPFSALKLNPSGKIILPNSSRSFENITKPILNFKPFSNQSKEFEDLQKVADVDFKTPWVGNVKFEVNANYINSEGDLDVVTKSTQIIFLPWKLGILIGFIILIFAVIFYLLKLRKKKILAKQK